MLDGFLELLNGGKAAVEGENLDATFKEKHALNIQGFTLSSESASARRKQAQQGTDEGDGELHAVSPAATDRAFALNFEVTREVDLASPALFRAYCVRAFLDARARPFDLAKVTLRKASSGKPLEYLVLQFTKVHVASYELDGGTGDKPPTETVSFTFRTCSLLYRPQKGGTGTAAARQTAWNFETPPKS
jgi:type VI protein secretion system component Hcp